MMTLHEDNKLFQEIIEATAQVQHIDVRYVEKDYWITRSLGLLAHSPYAEDEILNLPFVTHSVF